MKRASSIESLIKKANETLVALRKAYEGSLHEKVIRDDLRIDIKNIFENLRSCLDYIAHDIQEGYCPTATSKRLYFPIRDNVLSFEAAMLNDYPGLKQSNRAIYDILESVQPYRDSWLGHFNQLNNSNKHQDLVEQTKIESRHVTVSRDESRVSWGPGVSFGAGVSVVGVPIDPRTQMPVANNVAKTEVVIWVDFNFKENGLSVLPLVESSISQVEAVFRKIQGSMP